MDKLTDLIKLNFLLLIASFSKQSHESGTLAT